MKQWSPQLTKGLKMFSIFSLLALFSTAFGQETAPPYESYEAFTESPGFALFTINNLWILVSAALVSAR